MATILTHGLVGAGIALLVPLPRKHRVRLVTLSAVCAVLPDLDSIGLAVGIPYGHSLGHRGLAHSVVFALLLALLVGVLLFRRAEPGGKVWWWGVSALALATVSHGLLDAMTDGGLGIALLAPFSDERFFFPLRPLRVAPIGLTHFRGEWARRVLFSEALWVWIPMAVLVVGVGVGRRVRQSIAAARR